MLAKNYQKLKMHPTFSIFTGICLIFHSFPNVYWSIKMGRLGRDLKISQSTSIVKYVSIVFPCAEYSRHSVSHFWENLVNNQRNRTRKWTESDKWRFVLDIICDQSENPSVTKSSNFRKQMNDNPESISCRDLCLLFRLYFNIQVEL